MSGPPTSVPTRPPVVVGLVLASVTVIAVDFFPVSHFALTTPVPADTHLTVAPSLSEARICNSAPTVHFTAKAVPDSA